MKIKDYLKSVRNIQIKIDLLSLFFIFLSILISTITIFLLLESIFYFSPNLKTSVLITVLICIAILISLTIIYLINILKNRNEKYSSENVASTIGKKVFPEKQDVALNAFQIEQNTNTEYSKDLTKIFIDRVLKIINDFNPNDIVNNHILIRVKYFTIILMLINIIVLTTFNQKSKNAFYRWKNYNLVFEAPKPFQLFSLSKNKHILGGEIISIEIASKGYKPDSVYLQLTPIQIAHNKRDSLILLLKSEKNKNDNYEFLLPQLFQDYKYEAIVYAQSIFEAWNIVKSTPDTIFVTDRPQLKKFEMNLIPPLYSKLPIKILDGSVALIQGLKGSKIEIDLISNRNLKASFIKKNDSIIYLNTTLNKAYGNFTIENDEKFSIHLVDPRGITNKDPIPYQINIIPDNNPIIKIIKPTSTTTLGNNQIIEYQLEIQDDYGFSTLQLAYEIRRPKYLNVEPYIAMFVIPELNKDTTIQNINSHWNLTDLMLMPGDEVYYHFELSDNNEIPGPQKTLSKRLLVKVPSLAELYEELESKEENIDHELNNSLDELMTIKNELNDMKLNILKAEDELKWEDEQKLKEIINHAKNEIKKINKISEAMETIIKDSEKHDLFLPELSKKFKELSNLIKNIIPEDMLNKLNETNESIDELSLEDLKNAIEDLSNNFSEIESELDRYIDVFKRLQVEQKMDEIKNRIEKLVQQKSKLNNDIENMDENKDASRIAQEEQRGKEELNNIKNEIEEISKLVEPFSNQTTNRLETLKNNSDFQLAKSNINETINKLNENNINAALPSKAALNNLNNIQKEWLNIQKSFQKETVNEMAVKLEKIMRDLLFLSKKQESLKQQTIGLSRNSSKLKDLAYQQQILQDQLKKITNQILNISKETFAITPQLSKTIGGTNNYIEQTKGNLTNRNIKEASKNQNLSMEGLNKSALNIFKSIQDMKSSGSASGFEQFLKMMQQMAGQQQGLNQKGMNLSLGKKATSMQQQLMKSMLQSQNNIRQQLSELIKQMNQSGKQQGQGDLKGIAKDMDDVISDLSKFQYNRKTKNKQRKILSRMLDSQTSLSQKGFKDERKSLSGDLNKKYLSPGGLPIDLGQRQNIALDALNRSLNAGYSREYQNMIKRYFNTMTQLKMNKNNEIDNDEINQ